MEFKNTKPTAADFFRKYSDIVSEAEKDDDKKEEVKKDDSKKKEDKKDKKTLKEASIPTKWEQMMGITPQRLQEKYEGFAKVEKSVAKNPKVKDPGAVAASIGRKKYSKGKFQKMAAAGKKEEGCMEESEQITEKWGKEAELNPKKKGMFKGKTKADLKKQLSNLKKSGPHEKGSKEYTKQKELNFAIRAKSGWPKGKSSEK